jgi:hypothetical protein
MHALAVNKYRARRVLTVAAVFLSLRLLQLALNGWNTADEAYILQVTYRTAHGETLYKDVFFPCTPLLIYLTRACCFVLGYNVLVLKGLCAVLETGLFLATLEFLRILCPRIDWHARSRLGLLALVMFVIPGPSVAHLYNDLATLLVLLTGIAVRRWRHSPSLRHALAIGTLLGFAVAEKQNMGAYSALASTLAMLLPGTGVWKTRARHLVLVAALATAILTVFLLPAWRAGALPQTATALIGVNGEYVRIAGLNFFDGFTDLQRYAPAFTDFSATTMFNAALVFPLSLLAALVFIAGLFQPSTRRPLLSALPFLLVLLLSVYPRADAWLVAIAFPAVIIVLGVVAGALPRPIPALFTAVTALISGSLALCVLVAMPVRLASKDYVFSRLPHLKGVLLPKVQEDSLKTQAAQLAALPQPVFILTMEASGLYLVSRTHNPTPYDYPISSGLPPGSQQQIIADIRARRIQRVIMQPHADWYQLFIPQPLLPMLEQECQIDGKVGYYQVRRLPEKP